MITTKKKAIADLAEYIYEKFAENGQINPERIAEAKKITYSYGNYQDSFDGMLEYSENAFHIYVNLVISKYPSSGRSRFTFCHELGHYFLDEHRNALITGASKPHKSTIDFRSNLKVEREADIFAANLLIPNKHLSEKVNKKKLSGNLIVTLAEYFGSSITSTAIRVLKSNQFPFLLMKSENGKISWSWVSQSLKDKGYKFPIEGFGELNQGSLTSTFSSEKIDSLTILRQGTTASAWFNYVNESSSKNIILVEEIISIGEYGILTLIYPDGPN